MNLSVGLPHLQYNVVLVPSFEKGCIRTKNTQRKATTMTTATEQLPHKEQFPYVPFGLERGHLSAGMILIYKSRVAKIR